MFEISKRFKFEAAHSLPHLPEGHKCARLHGHSYVFEVVCRGELDHRDFVIDYAEISQAAERIIRQVDHTNLNDLFEFHTTAENLTKYIYNTLKEIIPVYQIHFYETATTKVTYPVK